MYLSRKPKRKLLDANALPFTSAFLTSPSWLRARNNNKVQFASVLSVSARRNLHQSRVWGTMRRRLIHLVCLIHVVFLLFLACAFLGGTKDDELFYESSEVVSNDLSLRGPSLPHLKHVTKSLLELGAMDEISSHIVFFNRIPKSGSEMLVLLIQWLEGWNNFRHVRLKTQNKKLTRLEQVNRLYYCQIWFLKEINQIS